VILVDSSVWISFFRADGTPEGKLLLRLLGVERIILGDLVLCETLRGIRSQRDLILTEDYLAAFEVVPMVGTRIARRAAANYRTLRGLGITIHKTVDLLIATWCLDNDVRLLHRDRDFEPFVTHFGLRVVRSA
jgi:predicted nucleic acid-binding protein